MKRDEVPKLFPDATEEQVSALLNQIGGELNPLKASLADATAKREQAAAALAAAQADAGAYKSALEEAQAKLKEGMTAEELLAEREAAAEQREREFQLKANALDAKAIFVASGYFGDDELDALVERVTSEDAEATKAFATLIAETVGNQRKGAAQAKEDELLKGNPSLKGAGAPGALTKKAFDEMSYEDQAKALEENPGLLASFAKPVPKM